MNNEHTNQSWYPDEVKAHLTSQIARLTSQLEALATFDFKEAAWLQAVRDYEKADKACDVALAAMDTATLVLSKATQLLRKDEDNV